MSLEPVLAAVAHRCARIRTGLAVGLGGVQYDTLRALRGGLWVSVDSADELPFDDGQFEVVVADASAVSRQCAKEAHRVLKPEGFLFFTVQERRGGAREGFTAPEIYKLVREGFDIVDLRRPPWWTFGRRGHTFTVCARKKNWREHRGFGRDGAPPLMPLRSRS